MFRNKNNFPLGLVGVEIGSHVAKSHMANQPTLLSLYVNNKILTEEMCVHLLL